LFVSGGDDYKIKVWNYKLRRCLFTLQGHLDYIRTVEFHHEQPWIVSASDDQTIRIWNWQSRTCISVLPGHNHYVMSASFHPREDLIVSASLDQTIRVWDISGLRKKSTSASPGIGAGGAAEEFMKMSQLNQDLFGTGDAMVKYILEGHDRGVNWASFHPTMQLIISAADDKQVKMWKINDTRAWEVDTLSGHVSNVSCAMFHAKKDLIISNSEDRTIRFYDLTKNNFIKSYRREHDRFWILDVHPTQNLIAAGHDTGLMVFKLERERPAYNAFKNELYYIKDKYLRRYNFKQGNDATVAILRRSTQRPARSLVYNFHENYVLVTSDQDGGSYELFKVPKGTTSSQDVEICAQIKRGKAVAAIFTGLKKYAILERSKKVYIKNITSESSREVVLPSNIGPVDGIFQATSGRLLLKTDDKIHLYDFEQQSVIASITASNTKYVVWSDDNSRVALLSKHVIVIANSKLEQMCSIHETIRIKSGSFDENGVFLYTTLNHMKYCLESGDSGTIKTLDLPLYLVKVEGNKIYYVDREGVVSTTTIDATEYKFKSALVEGKTGEIKNIIGQSKILGDSIIAYLQQKGYPQVAMRFVRDDSTKFSLALECGNIEAAVQAAHKLDQKDCWQRLGAEALRQGNLSIVEKCYQKTKDFERLSFLYLITGNRPNLQKMLKIASYREDIQSRFHNALFLGDVEQRIQILQEVGQNNLAYATAVTHGLNDLAENIKSHIDPNFVLPDLENTKGEKPTLLLPPRPILKETNWPQLTTHDISYTVDEDIPSSTENISWGGEGIGEGITADAFGTEGLEETKEKDTSPHDEDLTGGGGWGDELGLGDEAIQSDLAQGLEEDNSPFLQPNSGRTPTEYWVENSQNPSDHIAAGSFSTAMDILNKAAGIVNFAPLKAIFMNIYMASRGSIPLTPSLPSIPIPIHRNNLTQTSQQIEEAGRPYLPTLAVPRITDLNEKLKVGLKEMTSGKFEVAQAIFKEVMQAMLFATVQNKKDDREAKETIRICAEYVTAIRLELKRRQVTTSDQVRAAELASYFTRCRLNNIHIMLALNQAMTINFKLENFLIAANFANRLLKLTPNEKMTRDAKFVLQTKETKSTNKHELNYDDRNPFVICSLSMTPIYSGSPREICSYCLSPYLPKYRDQLCSVCDIGRIGTNAVGLYQYLQQFKTFQHNE
jgi:coatomer protein complex subunit alpha (xenin)